MKEFKIFLIILAIFLAVLLIVKENNKKPVTTGQLSTPTVQYAPEARTDVKVTPTPKQPKVSEQKMFEESFVLGCTEHGGTTSFCECSFNKLINMYGYEWMKKAAIEELNGTTSELRQRQIMNIVKECVNYF